MKTKKIKIDLADTNKPCPILPFLKENEFLFKQSWIFKHRGYKTDAHSLKSKHIKLKFFVSSRNAKMV